MLLQAFLLITTLYHVAKSDYTCPSSTVCVIDCLQSPTDRCSGIINATAATGLTLDCNGENSCASTAIYTPKYEQSRTRITCDHTNACNDARIYYPYDANIFSSDSPHEIHLICNANQSCNNTEIHATGAGTAQFDCNGIACNNIQIWAEEANNVKLNCIGPSSTHSGYGCNNLILHANDASNNVDIKCSGYHGCYKGVYWAQYAMSLAISADTDGIYLSIFHGRSTVEWFDITCNGNASDHIGCHNATFYVPNSYNLNCNGYGCCSLFLQTSTGLQYISNDPPSKSCDSTKSPTSNPITLSPTFDTLNPTAFPTRYPTVYSTLNPTNVSTINPTVNPSANPTTVPTANPTAVPSIYPTTNYMTMSSIPPMTTIGSTNLFDDMSQPIFIMAVIICIILGLMFIVCILIYFKIKNKNGQKSQDKVPTQSPRSENVDVEVDDDANEAKVPPLPKMYTLTPPGSPSPLAEQDSLNTEGDNCQLNVILSEISNEEKNDMYDNGMVVDTQKGIDNVGDVNRIELKNKDSALSDDMYENPEEMQKMRYVTPNTLVTEGEGFENENTPKFTKQQTGDV